MVLDQRDAPLPSADMAEPPPGYSREHMTWVDSPRWIPSRFVRPLIRFIRVESAGGVVLLVAAVIALLWANAPFGEHYEHFWETDFEISIGSIHLSESLRGLVNDGLMAIFFFVVGLEIKRELVTGDLRDRKAASLPVIAALGGMVVPALVYISFNGTGEASQGWGIPMATDIAFSVGVVSLLGRRVPVGAKLFLLALAIVDDIGAIAVIAIFYTDTLLFGYLAAAIGGLVAVAVANRIGVRSMIFYVPVALATWYFLLESGVHATLAGVALGMLTPVRSMYNDGAFHDRATRILDTYEFDKAAPRGAERVDQDALEVAAIARESVAPLHRLEHLLHPWSSFVIVPIFALANAGVRFGGVDLGEAITHPVSLGVMFGLFVGKIVGISVFSWLAVKFRLGVLPRFAGWKHIVGLAAIAGIGFTVSLFITGLAFDSALLADRAKLGIFVGSFASGVVGYLILRSIRPDEAVPSP